MKKVSVESFSKYDFTKENRGNVLAYITDTALKNLGKNYKLPKGFKTEFIEFNANQSTNAFADESGKRIYFSFDCLLNKDNFAKDIYNISKEVRRLAEYRGKYDENNRVDTTSQSFTSTEDLLKMITVEKSGNFGKPYDSINKDNLFGQISKDVQCYLTAKNFLSLKEKTSRKFAIEMLKKLLQQLIEQHCEDTELLNSIKEFIGKMEKEEAEQEEQMTQFVTGVERDIIDTMVSSQNHIADDLLTFGGLDSQVELYRNTYGFDPIKAGAQTLAITYNNKLANNMFNACVSMNGNMPKYLGTCLDLIKYTDFVPTPSQVHSLNTASKSYNETCKDSSAKIHPKKELKKFFNVKTGTKEKQSASAYENAQTM